MIEAYTKEDVPITNGGGGKGHLATSTIKAKQWQAIAARRQHEINDAIPEDFVVSHYLKDTKAPIQLSTSGCGILTTREQAITAMTAAALLIKIHDRSYTAVEVTKAFCKRAAIAHQVTNCLAFVMFEKALAEAATLDQYMHIHNRPRGPLHGLPISIKEHVYIKDTPSTSGFIAWADEIASGDALIVKILREAGAVFHVKTTNPQSLMSLETVSNLYGTTLNPHNIHLTPGGSSGGESALIAMRGSLMGVGTDIGGSIRVPSAFCGIYGLKPSIARIPHSGLAGVHAGMESIIGVVGPMATCLEDLRLFCKVVLAAQPWIHEPSLVELPWKTNVQTRRPLRIGVMNHDGIVQPHPPISRCLQETLVALEGVGHVVVPWDPSLHRDLIDCIDKEYFLDGGQEYLDVLRAGNEPPTRQTLWALERTPSKVWTVPETWKLHSYREKLRTAYSKQWNKLSLDAIICPVNPAAASAHGESTYWGYTSVFNILDYSATVFPAGFVQSTDTWDTYPPTSETCFNKEDQDFRKYYAEGVEGPAKYRGSPVALQVVTRRYREEEALDIVEIIQEAIKARAS